jgi:CRISPR-associated endonuclease Cas1
MSGSPVGAGLCCATLAQDDAFTRPLWKRIVLRKMRNQAELLDTLDVKHTLYTLIEKPLANEANVSRQFWPHYFKALGTPQKRERKGAESFENKALNYGYAVISTLTHRAILVHGLLPSLGIHHEYRYRSAPLVYDLMEPMRSFVDWLFYQWSHQQDKTVDEKETDEEELFKTWIHFLMNGLREYRVKHKEDKHSYKLMDVVDKLVRSIATCFEKQDSSGSVLDDLLWLPSLACCYRFKELDEAVEEDSENTIAV